MAEEHWDFILVFKNISEDEQLVKERLAREESIPNEEEQARLKKLNAQNSMKADLLNADLPRYVSRKKILQRMHLNGLDFRCFYSVKKELIFCKIRASEERLKQAAEHSDLKFELDEIVLRNCAENGIFLDNDVHIEPFPLTDEFHQFQYDPYDYIYAPFVNKPQVQPLYKKKGPDHTLFSFTDRSILIEQILTEDWGCDFDLNELQTTGSILGYFIPHHEPAKAELFQNWTLRWFKPPMKQPFEAIRRYFGVKIALYFVYLGHYTTWLVLPAICGVIAFIVQEISTYDSSLEELKVSPLSITATLFGLIMVLWSTLYLENWKRTNAVVAMKWGTSDYHENEHNRPEFEGKPTFSPINGEKIKYFPSRARTQRILYSWAILSILILIVFGLVALIFYVRYLCTKGEYADVFTIFGYSYGSYIASFGNLVQIYIMSKIYTYCMFYLNDSENHETDTKYENSLILKTIVFQFVNNYACLFYVACIKQYIEGCSPNCIEELELQLGVIFLSRIFVGNFQEIFLPKIWAKISQYLLLGYFDYDEREEKHESQLEQEYFKAEYGWKGTFDDYTEMVLQFGYTLLFVVAFPLCPLFSLINNLGEIRIDSYRLLYETKRPVPRYAGDIGSWFIVLRIMSAIGIATNGAVVLFTGNFIANISTTLRVWLFYLFVVLMFLIRYLLEKCIADTPRHVRAQLQRQKYLVEKAIYHIPDRRHSHPANDLEPTESFHIDETDTSDQNVTSSNATNMV